MKEKKKFDVNHLTPEEQLKFEIAEELGLGAKVLEGGYRSLTSRESGRLGGIMAKKKREMKATLDTCQNEQEQLQ